MLDCQYNPLMEENVIDERVLNSLRDAIGDDAMNEFLKRFFEDCVSRTERITEAYGHSRFSEVELEAHTLGTSAATYGALKLEGICRDIEFSKPIKSKDFQGRIDRLNLLSEQSLQALRDLVT